MFARDTEHRLTSLRRPRLGLKLVATCANAGRMKLDAMIMINSNRITIHHSNESLS